jgi:NAD(P)-dependent dehydrogenase (short-subunit alcohol dehydrogenase family)
MRLSGKVALVTGASGNIGRAIVKRLGAEGARVVPADLNVPSAPYDGLVALDVAQAAAWEMAISTVEARFGGLDILVNAAGISGGIDPDAESEEAWDLIMDVNAKGVFLGMRAAWPLLRRSGAGAIVNISSISGFVGQRGAHSAYPASKGAVRIMTKTAALRFAPEVRVNSVHPGVMPEMATSSFAPGARDAVIGKIPLKRVGTADEVANAVLFLASSESSYITGTELVVDGGLLAG